MEFSLLAPTAGWELITRLGVSLLVGAIIGLEREQMGKSAGLRTYMLVSFGVACFILVPIQLNVVRQSADAFSRVLQGLIAGVGFIGGGAILRDRSDSDIARVKGLTSAAAIWVAAALGLAAACGLWQLALVGAGVAFFILRALKYIEP